MYDKNFVASVARELIKTEFNKILYLMLSKHKLISINF